MSLKVFIILYRILFTSQKYNLSVCEGKNSSFGFQHSFNFYFQFFRKKTNVLFVGWGFYAISLLFLRLFLGLCVTVSARAVADYERFQFDTTKEPNL